MSNHDLFDFMEAATREMAEEYNRIQKRATEDSGTAGDQGEENWATLLKGWLPSDYHVVTKGRIVGENGKAGPQVDILILKPEYPVKLLDKKLYLAGGVLAAFECKVTLKACHITDAVKKACELRGNLPEVLGTPYSELQSPILYGLLAHSHSWQGRKSNPIDNVEKALSSAISENCKHPRQLLDIICVSDLASWNCTKFLIDWPNILTVFIRLHKKDEEPNSRYTPIGTFISTLMKKLSVERQGLRSLARYFVMSNIMGPGKGQVIKWPAEVLSGEVREKIKNDALKPGDRLSDINEWHPIIP